MWPSISAAVTDARLGCCPPWPCRDQYAALLPINERVLGAEHPATLNTRNNLARWTRRADRGEN